MSIHLGILLPKSKKRNIKLPERIEDLCEEAGIQITDLDVDSSDFESNGPFDVFLHNISKYYNVYSDEVAREKITKAKRFAMMHKDMVIIDDFFHSEKMTDRKYMSELLQACQFSMCGIDVFVPKILEVPENATLGDVQEIVRNNHVTFPILAKPIYTRSHAMTLIFSYENLTDLPIPCFMQEFCNHGGVLYKVFIVGDNVNLCQRPSIKDVDCASKKTLTFVTKDVSKMGIAFLPEFHETDPNKRRWLSCDEKPDMLNRVIVDEMCQRVRKKTNLHLLGLDVLVEKGSGNYALIDANHFPGYSGINDNYFPQHLVELIKKVARK